MNKLIAFTRNPRTGVHSMAGKPSKRECPKWLASQFRSFRASYLYSNGPCVAEFQSVTWWRDTSEWVGVYAIQWQMAQVGRSGVDKFVFAFRSNEFVEVRQFAASGTWRARAW